MATSAVWLWRFDGAVVLMGEITSRLNAARLPFRFKVLNDPGAYNRCDAGVLYLRRYDYRAAAGMLAHIYPLVAASLGRKRRSLPRRWRRVWVWPRIPAGARASG